MSGETEANISAWTNDTVLAHLQMLLEERAQALAAVMDERDRKYAEFRSTLGSEIDGLRTLIDDRRDAASVQADERDRRYEQRFDERDRRYEQRFIAQQNAVLQALDSAKEAVVKAETATEKRFEGVNEFRAQLADQARELMPRKETENLMTTIADRVLVLERKSDTEQGRTLGASATIAIIISVAVTIASVIGVILALLQA